MKDKMERLIKEKKVSAKSKIMFVDDGGGVDWKQVPQEIGFEYYRIVQETVGNAIRHAEDTCICVDLSLEGKRLSLLVTFQFLCIIKCEEETGEILY